MVTLYPIVLRNVILRFTPKIKTKLRYKREEATSAIAGFHAGPLSWSNWLEMLIFVEGGKQENPEKNPCSKARINNKLNPHMIPGRNRTQPALVRGTFSHCCAILAPQRFQKPDSL